MAEKARAPFSSPSSLTSFRFDEASQGEDPETSAGATPVDYRAIADIYRQRWRWDKVVKGTHILNCWYQRNCCFNLYVKDGLVLREEQSGEYPRTNPFVPDFNPRGCQSGACYSVQVYHPARIK
jgi:nitrate reductase alpha subunit